ncbi:MAG: hypothetical protein AAGD07_01625 [Planctomycetota bacterium]
MSASNRSKLITKLHTALKKHYKAPPASPSRPILEHILLASLLEDCPLELAEEGLLKCEQDFFDWNEVRVTTVTELSGVLSNLPDPQKAASRLKGNLQGVFEEFYNFDLEYLKKENLGKAVAKFEKIPSMSPFVVAYLTQHGLGGHAIPIDYSAMVILHVTGIASQREAASGRVPGLERAIPKTKGVEFAALIHEAAVAVMMDPKDKKGRQTLDAVAKGSSKSLDEYNQSKEAAKQRVRKRKIEERDAARAEKAAEEAKPKAVPAKKPKASASGTAKAAKEKKAASPPAAAEGKKPNAKPAKTSASKTKPASKTTVAKKASKPVKKSASKTAKKSASKPVKKSTAKAAAKPTKKKPVKKSAKKTAGKKKAKPSKAKSGNRRLTKQKPR